MERLAKIRMHVAICFSCILAVAIVAHKIGRPTWTIQMKPNPQYPMDRL